MKDFLKSYTHTKRAELLSIIGISFVLAFSLNFILGNGEFGKSVKSSIVDRVEEQENIGNMYLSLIDNGTIIALKTGQDLKNVSKINFSLGYNPEGLRIEQIESQLPNLNIQTSANEAGFQSIFGILSTPQDIKKDTIIAKINTSKLSQKIEYINLIATNFEDTNKNITELSSSGIDF